MFESWLDRDLPTVIFDVVKLSGFGVTDPHDHPVHWEIYFETTGKRWLGITIPFVGVEPKGAVVDT